MDTLLSIVSIDGRKSRFVASQFWHKKVVVGSRKVARFRDKVAKLATLTGGDFLDELQLWSNPWVQKETLNVGLQPLLWKGDSSFA